MEKSNNNWSNCHIGGGIASVVDILLSGWVRFRVGVGASGLIFRSCQGLALKDRLRVDLGFKNALYRHDSSGGVTKLAYEIFCIFMKDRSEVKL